MSQPREPFIGKCNLCGSDNVRIIGALGAELIDEDTKQSVAQTPDLHICEGCGPKVDAYIAHQVFMGTLKAREIGGTGRGGLFA